MFGFGSNESSGSSGIDPTQLQWLEENWARGRSVLPGAQQGVRQAVPGLQSGVVNPTLAAFAQLIGGQGGSPFLEQQIENQNASLNRSFQENVLPSLRRGATQTAGFGSSSGHRAQLGEGVAGRGLLDAQNRGENQLRFDAFYQQLGAQLQAMQNAGNIFNLGLQPSLAPFAPLQQMAALIGNPVTGGSQDSTGFTFDWGGFGSE